MTATATTEMFSAASLREDVSYARVALAQAQAAQAHALAAAESISVSDPAHSAFARIVERAAESVIDARQALHEAEARRDRWV